MSSLIRAGTEASLDGGRVLTNRLCVCRSLLRAHLLTRRKFNVAAPGRDDTGPFFKFTLDVPSTEVLRI
jgi:hypothetical protein